MVRPRKRSLLFSSPTPSCGQNAASSPNKSEQRGQIFTPGRLSGFAGRLRFASSDGDGATQKAGETGHPDHELQYPDHDRASGNESPDAPLTEAPKRPRPEE